MTSRYRFAARETAPSNRLRTGEIVAACPADVRHALRAQGLRPIRVSARRIRTGGSLPLQSLRRLGADYVRGRRGSVKAELCDALATLLASEVTLAESLGTLAGDSAGSKSARRLAARLESGVRSGETLSASAAQEVSWFDPSEIAMLQAAELSGELARVLRTITDRALQTDERRSAIGAALLYPSAVALVGVAVAIFLANRTLPQLVGVLESAGVEPPRLTAIVMTIGQAIWTNMIMLALVLAVVVAAAVLIWSMAARRWPRIVGLLRRAAPKWTRDQLIARWLRQFSDLLEAGVPMTEALVSAASTCRGVLGSRLRADIEAASAEIHSGADAVDVLHNVRDLGAEVRQVIRVGADAGELGPMLRRIADRLDRRADRSLTRWSRLIEPAAILVMAACVGVVVMAAMLPILRLQEIVQ